MTGLAIPFTDADADADAVASREATGPASLSLFGRIGAYLYAVERRRRERDIAALLAQNGGQLTDDLERQISRQFGRIVE